MGAGTHAGMRSAPPTAQALAGTLDQMTGLTTGQVQLRDVCPAVAPGLARCAAQALILPNHPPVVRPDVARTRPLALGPRSATAGGRERRVGARGQPAGGRHAGVPPAGVRPLLAVSDGRARRHGRDRRRVRRPDRGVRPRARSAAPPGCPRARPPTAAFARSTRAGAASPLPAHDTGWEEEISLDLDAVSALCPNCHILLVEANSTLSTDMTTAMQTAASLGAKQISDSWSVIVERCRRAAPTRSRASMSSPPPATTAIQAPGSTTIRRRLPGSRPPAARRSARPATARAVAASRSPRGR